MIKRISHAALVTIAITLSLPLGLAQTSTPTRAIPFPKSVKWQPRFAGVHYAELTVKRPRIMRGHMLRIDLRCKGVTFVATPDNGERQGETDSWKTSTFLKKTKCQAAINAAPFSPVRGLEGRPQDVSGLMVHNGKVVSPPQSAYPSLLITKDNKVSIAKHPFPLEDVYNAVSGFGIVLRDGRILPGGQDVHPRTGAGISKDGRFLYLLVIDGRQPGYSEGATTREVAAWLAFLGAADGINLDGGGTSTMVLAEPDGSAKAANRPIHMLRPGRERPGGSHLGIRAPLLEGE